MKFFDWLFGRPKKSSVEIAQDLADKAFVKHGDDQQLAETFIRSQLPKRDPLKELTESLAIVLYIKKTSKLMVDSMEISISGRQSE